MFLHLAISDDSNSIEIEAIIIRPTHIEYITKDHESHIIHVDKYGDNEIRYVDNDTNEIRRNLVVTE
jgi:hypothetical protein